MVDQSENISGTMLYHWTTTILVGQTQRDSNWTRVTSAAKPRACTVQHETVKLWDRHVIG